MSSADLADVIPEQGCWTERQYLALSTPRLVEFDNGVLEVLPSPTKTHQLIVAFLYEALKRFIAGKGVVLFAAYPFRVLARKYREPDVLYMTPEQDAQAQDEFTNAVELAMEVVSPDDPDRDYVTKRSDYARAGVAEYWIVDHLQGRVTVLRLDNGQYVEHGVFGAGQRAMSARLPGLSVAVDEILAQGK
jgi:Uma2 family endonuclease